MQSETARLTSPLPAVNDGARHGANPVGPSLATPRDYFETLKPRVMSLVVFTALVGMVVAPGHINPVIGGVALLFIAIGAGAAGALNMWYEADLDAMMSRTMKRPIPDGRIQPGEVLGFALSLAIFSVVALGLFVNLLSAALLAFTIFFYAVIYSMWLKRWTPQNIVIGGAAGALPPVIGWAAATGSVSLEPIVMFLIIFVWTPPHFWALAMLRTDEYARAGIPMLPVVAGERETRRQIVLYSILMAPVGALPYILGYTSALYGTVSIITGAMFVMAAFRLRNAPEGEATERAAKKLFGFSILYLGLLFAVLLIDRGFGLSFGQLTW
ncbi:heme o synthase [Pseudorhodoplanes sinuspersici]|uniref:Protoheme IX farnesyltransferase n=1 Tax=Pseudorhodoplanes sinuspersici TaxID=1235591 RepID=A0A1W6ZZE5_9HYPH|nr:heme o synthase [Pseudorhodoplanes sinuspersici]ARQ02767.1 protoheme IX farnesyltransferase [Pseudorhodoplanes sinuspersici]